MLAYGIYALKVFILFMLLFFILYLFRLILWMLLAIFTYVSQRGNDIASGLFVSPEK